MIVFVLITLTGSLLFVIFAWSWRGNSRRARWWVDTYYGPEVALGVLPGLAGLIGGAGLLGLAQQAGETVFGVTALALALPVLAALILEFAGLFALLPRWWGPKWYRSTPRRLPQRSCRRRSHSSTTITARLPDPAAERPP